MKRYKLYMFCSLATCIDLNSLNIKKLIMILKHVSNTTLLKEIGKAGKYLV